MKKIFILVLIALIFTTSCNKKPKKTAEEYYSEANTLMYGSYPREYDAAITLLKEALSFYHDNPELLTALAACYNDLNDFETAMIIINNLIKRYPDYALAYKNRGTIKSNLNDHYGSILDYKKAHDLDNRIYVDLNIAEEIFDLGDYKGVIEYMNRIPEFKFDDEEYFLISQAYFNLNNFEEAGKYCLEAIKRCKEPYCLNLMTIIYIWDGYFLTWVI